MRVPGIVEAVCTTFLEAAPAGLVEGLYLRGGLGFGEWVPGQSDVDFVATLARMPEPTEVEALRVAHQIVADRHPDVPFDGMHILLEHLAADPGACPDAPVILHGQFQAEGRLDPEIAWHELAWHGLTVHGPDHCTLEVWTSRAALRAFTRTNLDTYWRDNAEALAAMPTEGAREDACCWCVLGVARLHHLLVTGEMTTKNGAGRWGSEFYPRRFRRVLREALRIRNGGRNEYRRDPETRGTDTASFVAYVVDQGAGMP